jgi:LAO/AO transport system kinase
MAARGSLGGLAVTTREVVDLLDAFGFDRILIETVGVGQSELDIAAAADTTVVVLVPESGDAIQAMKAGLMEISDLFVINKSDRPGADRLANEVKLMLRLRAGDLMRRLPAHHGVDLSRVRKRTSPEELAVRRQGALRQDAAGSAAEAPLEAGAGASAEEWAIPVLQTIAEGGKGVPELLATLDRHRSWLVESGEGDRRREARFAERVREVADRSIKKIVWVEKGGDAILQAALPDLQSGRKTPYQVAARIVRELIG